MLHLSMEFYRISLHRTPHEPATIAGRYFHFASSRIGDHIRCKLLIGQNLGRGPFPEKSSIWKIPDAPHQRQGLTACQSSFRRKDNKVSRVKSMAYRNRPRDPTPQVPSTHRCQSWIVNPRVEPISRPTRDQFENPRRQPVTIYPCPKFRNLRFGF
jgi:hypothetical protein